MASSESNTFEEESKPLTIERANMPIEITETSTSSAPVPATATTQLEMDNKTVLNSTAPSRPAAYRGVGLSQTNNSQETEEDSWWSEVENNDLLLDQVPNVTSVFTPSPEAILEKSISVAESETVLKDENFERLHKIADKIKMTLSEHAKNKELEENQLKERKISETSDKDSLSETDFNHTTTTTNEYKEQSLDEFKAELRTKRLQRQNTVQELRDEIASLRQQLQQERETNKRLRRGEHVKESSSICTLTSSETEGASALSDDEDPLARSRHANIELANAQLALQMAQSENISLRGELAVVQKQVVTLKEVIACCKQMLAVKEEQCNELKQRLTEIEKSFAEREVKIMSDNLRQEYERQLLNIRQLKQLYEERQRVAAAEYENLQRLISIKRDELTQEQEKNKTLEERNQNLAKEIDSASNELACLRDECREHKFEKATLKEEIGAVNTLFSQMVMGFNGKNNLDIDRLTRMLEENRTLLNDMATKECTDGATLPKLLFELVEQACTNPDDNKKPTTPTTQYSHSQSLSGSEDSDTSVEEETENDAMPVSNVIDSATSQTNANTQIPLTPFNSNDSNVDVSPTAAATPNPDGKAIATMPHKIKKHHHRKITTSHNKKTCASSGSSTAATIILQDAEVIGKVTSAQEIIGNLPKVWRVLMELLSHHKIDPVQFEENGKGEDCYKSIETPNGPKAELSVSKTYLKLKDLILEKKSLVKETNRLKTLNSHLDYRLNEQEKRLSAVSLELTKTWHLVGKMQRQHRQLHTQEQILRYQLQQKRRLLSELKEELEYCRRKWAAARAKNDESQEQYNDLRREFARRKLEDANNSAESGYSDSGGPVSDEEAALPAEIANIDTIDSVENVMKNAHDGDDEADDDDDIAASVAAGGCVNYRRKRLREMFEHTRKIKRMQSTSPGRAGNILSSEEVVLRWNSAPPSCGWRYTAYFEEDDFDSVTNRSSKTSKFSSDTGNLLNVRSSRHLKRRSTDRDAVKEPTNAAVANVESDDRANRIQRLEEQCKTLIKQVLETSDNRERLEVQLNRFQDELPPVQYAVPLEEFIKKKRFERMTRASSVPVAGSSSGCLTPREEEYTRKRSERLERLEEESRQLMSRIKRTSDRGHYLRCSLDRIRRAPVSSEGSLESNTEDDLSKSIEKNDHLSGAKSSSTESSLCENAPRKSSPLTAEEEAYTERRAARLQRLEEESKQLLTKLSKNNQRGDRIGNKLDVLHERYKSQEEGEFKEGTSASPTVEQRIENIEKISSNREERLRLLEEEGRQLINKLSETSERGTKMINGIAERELNRQKRIEDNDKGQVVNNNSTSEETPVTSALLPTPKNVACSSIVSEELTDRVTITTTASQIAAHQGAIPKSKPTLQLLAARPKSARLQKRENKITDNPSESLEDMVRRLKSLPFPGEEKQVKNLISEEEIEINTVKKDIAKFEEMDNKTQEEMMQETLTVIKDAGKESQTHDDEHNTTQD